MPDKRIEELGLLFTQLSQLFKSVSPYAESNQVAGTFRSLLDKMKNLYYTELGGSDENLIYMINQGYALINEMPKCLSPTPNCRKEHENWGLRVQELTYQLIGEFKRKGIDLGYSPPSATQFKLDEQNLLKIGFVAVVGLIILNLLKGK